MRLPNGTGTVYNMCRKSKGKTVKKRRKPWAAVVTIGFELNEATGRVVQKRRFIGSYETKEEALKALADYNANPYDIDANRLTFNDVYEMWSKEYFEGIVPSAVRSVTSAYKRWKPLYDMRFADIKVRHIEGCIRDADCSDNIKQRMKSVINLMFKYALRHEIVSVDYASISQSIKRPEPEIVRIPFNDDEINTLMSHQDIPFADMLLVGIYSGWRPQELCMLRSENVDLGQETFQGGMKTDAGKNRVVPIHPKILPIVRKHLEEGNEYLFMDSDGSPLTYDRYRNRFKRVCQNLCLQEHKPHDTRHTFVTLAKEAGVDEYILKRIVGHSIRDVTELVYTHRDIEKLKEEIRKIQ